MKVLIAGGGTAGHVFPAISLAQELAERGIACSFVGAARGLESRLVPEAGFELLAQDVIGFPRRPSIDLVRAPAALLRAVGGARPLARDADVVVGVGGYASAPGVLAARKERTPVVLHEQNAVPGSANRLFSRWASVVALSFAESSPAFPKARTTVVTGNPVRRRVAEMARDVTRQEALRAFGFEESRKTLLVFGGSQGALHVNQAIAGCLGRWSERADLQVLVLTGAGHEDVVASRIPEGKLMVRAQPFLDAIELAYSVADLVVCRAGATSIAEVTACGLPALLIPYPHATSDHQTANARSVVAAGAAEVMRDDELSRGTLGVRIDALLADGAKLDAMSAAASALGSKGAAGRLADLVEDAAR